MDQSQFAIFFPGTQPAPSGKVPPEKLQHFQARDFGWCWNVGCLAAQLQNVTPWTSGSARILERSSKFSIIVLYWWRFFPQDSFSLGEGKSPETTKSGMSQNDYDSGCWMIVVHWDAIPAFWFFVLVICKGMFFYFKELPQRSQKSNMFGHHSGRVAMMWNNLIPNRSCHPLCETPPAILFRQKSS